MNSALCSLALLNDTSSVSAALKTLNESDADPLAFVRAGGVKAVVDALNTQTVSNVDTQSSFEQGCVLLMSVAGAALDGDCTEAADALVGSRAAVAIVDGLARHADSAAMELGEAGIACLMQLACVDLPSAFAAGIAAATVRVAQSVGAGGWLLFLCARTLSWCAVRGGESGLKTLRKAGSVKALLDLLKKARRCDPKMGEPFGVPDALDQMEVEARRALAHLVNAPGLAPSKGSEGGLHVAVFTLGDRCVIHGLVAKPLLKCYPPVLSPRACRQQRLAIVLLSS